MEQFLQMKLTVSWFTGMVTRVVLICVSLIASGAVEAVGVPVANPLVKEGVAFNVDVAI